MNKEQANIKLLELREKLNKWAYEYYVLDNPTIDDLEYDLAITELLKIEEKFPELITFDSISQRVGGIISDKFKKYTHKTPMLSLGDVFSWEEFLNFNKQVSKETGTLDNEYFAELKIDGLSISLNYADGKLMNGVTRGDGTVGEDVTVNVKTIKSIPLLIPDKNQIEIRGEIFLSKKEFQKINDERLINGEQLFANPRNAAAGTIRQLDSSIVAKRNLDGFMYYYLETETNELKTQEEALKKIASLGLKTNKFSRLCKTLDEAREFIEEFTNKRSELDYEIDGIVFKINDFKLHERIGYTTKTPKWAIAYKFPAEIKETKLLDIFPTVGRTGKITYNAKLEPVQLAGTNVSAATLNNAEYIKTKDLRIGSIVKVKKAGDIIPEVIGAIKDDSFENLNPWSVSKECPACGTILEKSQGEVDQFCVNFTCPAQIIRSLEHYASRQAANIFGFGERAIKFLFEKEIIKNISDIYSIENYKNEIINFENFGEKSYSNLITSIENSKTNSLEKILFGLGIRHIGSKTAKIIAKKFNHIDKLMLATYKELSSINSIGTVLAQSIVDWFAIESNRDLIQELKDKNVNFEYHGEAIKEHALISNKSFVITGTLSKSRDYFKNLIELNGGNVIGSVSKKTDYVLYGEEAGSKYDKAITLNIKLLNEEEFIKLLEENNG